MSEKKITCYPCSGGHVHIVLTIDGEEHEISLHPESALEFSEDIAESVEDIINAAADDEGEEAPEKKVTIQ